MQQLLDVSSKRMYKLWASYATDKTNHAIHQIVIYPVDSVIHFSNNRDLKFYSLSIALVAFRGFPLHDYFIVIGLEPQICPTV